MFAKIEENLRARAISSSSWTFFGCTYAKRFNRMTKKVFPRKFLRQSKSLWSKKHRQKYFSVETISPEAQSGNGRHRRRRNQTRHKLRLRRVFFPGLLENIIKKNIPFTFKNILKISKNNPKIKIQFNNFSLTSPRFFSNMGFNSDSILFIVIKFWIYQGICAPLGVKIYWRAVKMRWKFKRSFQQKSSIHLARDIFRPGMFFYGSF